MGNQRDLEIRISELEKENVQLSALVECLRKENEYLKNLIEFHEEYSDEIACPRGVCED